MSADPVPNVRFNVCKCIGSLVKMNRIESPDSQQSVKECLDRLKQDPDTDVRYFAEQAIQVCESSTTPGNTEGQNVDDDKMMLSQ